MQNKGECMKIVLSIVLGLFLIGCSNDNEKKSVESVKKEVVKKEEVKEPVKVKEVVKKEEVKKPVKVKEVVKKKEEIKKPVEVKEVTKVVQPQKTQEKKVEMEVSTRSGKEIFGVCAGCHGADASRSALGKSKVIKGWNAQKVTDALHGYRAGTYGGSMKGLMKGQVLKLSETDIKNVSEYISGL